MHTYIDEDCVLPLQVVAFSHAFLIGVPGGTSEEEQSQWTLPVQTQALLYGARHLAVVLVLARYQRLHRLAVEARARAEMQAMRAADRRERAVTRLTSALPAFMRSVRTFRAASTGGFRRALAAGVGSPGRGDAARDAESEILQTTVSATMQRVIDRTHGTPPASPGHPDTAASTPAGPVSEAITSTTFERRCSDERPRPGIGPVEPECPPVSPSLQAAGTIVLPAEVPAVESARADLQSSRLTGRRSGSSTSSEVGLAEPPQSDPASCSVCHSEVSFGEGVVADVVAMSALPPPPPPAAVASPRASPNAPGGSIWSRFEQCREQMRAAVRSLPREALPPGLSLTILQQRLRRFPMAFRTSALKAALAEKGSWQHQAGLRLLLEGGIYGIVAHASRSAPLAASAGSAPVPSGGRPQVAVHADAPESPTTAGAATSGAPGGRGKWRKLKGLDGAEAEPETAGVAAGGGWGAIRRSPAAVAKASGDGGAVKRGWGSIAAATPSRGVGGAGQTSMRRQLLEVIRASKADPALIAQKPFEAAWARVCFWVTAQPACMQACGPRLG